MLRPSIVGMRGSMVIRLGPCMTWVLSPPGPHYRFYTLLIYLVHIYLHKNSSMITPKFNTNPHRNKCSIQLHFTSACRTAILSNRNWSSASLKVRHRCCFHPQNNHFDTRMSLRDSIYQYFEVYTPNYVKRYPFDVRLLLNESGSNWVT